MYWADLGWTGYKEPLGLIGFDQILCLYSLIKDLNLGWTGYKEPLGLIGFDQILCLYSLIKDLNWCTYGVTSSSVRPVRSIWV